jgi:hypothetical protein
MMEMFIMRDTTVFFACHNIAAIPRIGDTITSGNVKVKVKDVIWHIDHTTWVEVQV